MREAKVARKTRETNIEVEINLDGSGKFDINTGIGFFNHMFETLSRHSLIDITLNASGDINVDYHHLVEDCGIVLGQAVNQALKDKAGIRRFGNAILPLDEALSEAVMDISGRPHLETNLTDYTGTVGEFNFELGEVFFSGFASEGFTVHINVRQGKNLHHILESAFKSFARALRSAVEIDDRMNGRIPSTKDHIED